MISQGAKDAAIGVSILMAVALLSVGGCHLSNNQTADSVCYQGFRNTYTFESARPELDVIWRDKRITVGECSDITSIHDKAALLEDTLTTQQEVDNATKL